MTTAARSMRSPIPRGDGTWITGMSFEPDAASVVHHAIISRVPASALPEIEARSAEDDKPGYECFVGEGLTTGGVYNIAGWAPGQQPSEYPRRCRHLPRAGRRDRQPDPLPLRPRDPARPVHDRAADRDRRRGGRRSSSDSGSAYTTPAEMPCTPEEIATGAPLCDRDAVLVELAGLYGETAAYLPRLHDPRLRRTTVRLRPARWHGCAQLVRPCGPQHRHDLLGARPHARVRCFVPDDPAPGYAR